MRNEIKKIQLVMGWLGLVALVAPGCPGGAPVKGPDSVTGFNAVGENRQVSLSWNSVMDADSYNVYFSTEPGVTDTDQKISGVTSPVYTHAGLANGTTYYYVVTAQNSDGESDLSEEISATPTFKNELSGVLVSPEAQAQDSFGWSIAIDGNYVIAGTPWEDGGPGDPTSNSGTAHIFRRIDQDDWDGGVKLIPADRQAGDFFGHSVAIHGDYAVVGAYMEDGGAGDPVSNAGAVYVFRRIGDNAWDTGVKLVAPDDQAGDRFGNAVSIHGSYIIVGAPSEDGGSGDSKPEAGAAYVYRRIGINSWDNGTKLVAPDVQGGDMFGYSVGIHGDLAIVGAYAEDGGDGDPMFNAGAAYIYRRIGETSWSGGERLAAEDAQADDYFGWSVSISENSAIVGAVMEDGGPGDPLLESGAAYIFEKNFAGDWVQVAKLSAEGAQQQDWFGWSVAIDGSFAVVGSPTDDGEQASPIINAGAAYVFYRDDSGVWSDVTKLTTGGDAQELDNFGVSVSINGSYIVVSAPNEDGGSGDPMSSAGAVYVF